MLGAILLDNAALARVSDLRASEFFFRPNQILFTEMLAMRAAGAPIDTLTLKEHLHSRNALESVGGTAYIDDLVDGVPRVMHVEQYARIIKVKALLRAIVNAANEVKERAFAAEEEPYAILGRARLAFGELAEQQEAGDIFDTWDEFQNAKPLRALIDSFLWADVANVIGGLSGEGKTLILLASTKALLTGKPLFGHFRVLEPLDRVVYLIPECSAGAVLSPRPALRSRPTTSKVAGCCVEDLE